MVICVFLVVFHHAVFGWGQHDCGTSVGGVGITAESLWRNGIAIPTVLFCTRQREIHRRLKAAIATSSL